MTLITKLELIKLYERHNCLIVDDMPEMRGAMKRMISTQGIARIDTAANAQEAMSMCRSRPYSLIICDYNLGRSQDGQQLLEALRAKKLLTPVGLFVMITAETSREMVLGAIESQPDDYVAKPFTPKQFCLRLDRVLIKHEALLPIKKLFAEKNYREAIEVCEKMLARGAKFAFEIERIKGRILFLLGELHKSREHYESIVEQRPLPWAMLGLAETLVELGAMDQAEIILQKVLAHDQRYVEARDLLARVHLSRSDIDKAQEEIEHACKLSPKSVLRHRKLAEIAEANGDVKTSTRSFQHAIKWGMNSIHEDESDVYNFARKAAHWARDSSTKESYEQAEKARKILTRKLKDNPDDLDVQLKGGLILSSLEQAMNKPTAEKSNHEARQLFRDNASDDADCHLDYVQALQDAGETEEAEDHLHAMAAEFAGESKVLAKIERAAATPVTQGSKEKVASLTKLGISAYQNKDYRQATRVFQEALAIFPNHPGLNLNLVQVLLEQYDGAVTQRDAALIKRCFERTQNVKEGDAQAARAKALQTQFGETRIVDHYPT